MAYYVIFAGADKAQQKELARRIKKHYKRSRFTIVKNRVWVIATRKDKAQAVAESLGAVLDSTNRISAAVMEIGENRNGWYSGAFWDFLR